MKPVSQFLTSFSLFFLAYASLAAPPNVILIMTDDQGYGDFGATGNKLIRTPHIDAMAERSAMMTTFYVSPVCSPTRASLMTGRYNFRTRCINTWLGNSMVDPEEVTIAEVLSEAGYATGIFGKWHLGDAYPMRAIDQGFDEALVHRGGGLAQPADHPDNNRRYTDAILYRNGKPEQTKGYCTDVYFDNAMDFVSRKSDSQQPFFTYIATNAPHSPFHDVPETLRREYEDVPLEDLFTRRVFRKRIPREKDTLGRIAAMITNVDDNIGRLFAFLEEENLIDNTLVIFLTDNGPNTARYNGPFRGKKTDVYEGGVRTPLWLHWPSKFKPGMKRDTLTAHIDLMPTILDVCDVPLPEAVNLDGRSFLPILEDAKAPWPERTITLQWHRGTQPQRYHQFMTRDNRWKLVHSSDFTLHRFEGAPDFELYDLKKDPIETKNLASRKPEIVARLKASYDAWFDDVSSTRPDNFAPPLIQAGTPYENPTVLTRQDWISKGWDPNVNGHWNVDFRNTSKYDVLLHLYENDKVESVELHIGENSYSMSVPRDARSITIESIEVSEAVHKVFAEVRQGESVTSPFQIEILRR